MDESSFAAKSNLQQRGELVKRPWLEPAVTQLPKLSDLTLQSPIPGGGGTGGGGSTVIP